MAITYSNVQVTKVLTLRGNTIQNNRYTGLPGELTVDTEAKTIRIHDGVTPGGNVVQGGGGASSYGNANVKVYLSTFDGNILPSANVTYSLGSLTRQWKDLFVSNNTIYVGGVPLGIDATGNLTINGNVIPTLSYVNTVVANVTVDLSSYALNANVTAANVGIIGYIDRANTIQSSQVNAANLSITAANVGLKGYVDQANTIQSAQLISANLGIIGYIDLANTIQSAQISAANVGMRGYVDQANTIQSSQVGAANLAITAANVGMKGYVDSQSFYSNVKVATYLPTYDGNIAANISKSGYTWTFGTDAVLTLPSGATILESGYGSAGAIRLKPNGGTSTQYLEIAPTAADGNHVHLMAGSGTELFLGDDNQYVKLANTGGVVINSNDSAGNTAQWTFGQDGTTLFPNQAIDGGTAPIELKSRSWSQLTYNNVDMNQQPNKNHSTTFYVEGGDALLEIFRWDSGNVMQHRQWTFFHDGNLTLPSGGYILNSDNSIYGGGNYSNVEVATYLQSGNIANVSVAGNVTATYFVGNGALLTGVVGSASNYGNVDVRNFLKTGDGASRLIQGYYANIDLGATARLFSFGATAKSYFGHDGFLGNTSINYIRADNGDVRIATNNAAKTWTFDNTGLLTFAGTLTSGATFDGNDFIAAPNSFIELAGYTGNTYVGLDDNNVFIQTNWNTAGKQWTFANTGNITFPDNTVQSTAWTGGSYSNVQVATYLPTYSGNVRALNFIGAIQAQVGFSFNYATDAFGATYDNSFVFLPSDANSNAIVAGYTIVGNSGAVTLTVTSATVVEGSPNFVQVATTPTASNFAYPVTVYTANYSPALPLSTITVGNATVSGNVTAQYFVGNGAFLTGIVASGGSGTNYSNVNVKAYTESMGFQNYGNVNVAALITTNGLTNYSNVNTAAYLNSQGYNLYSNVNVAAYLTTYGGAIQSSNVQTTTANIQALTASTNTATGALRIMGGAGIRGNLNVGSLDIPGALHTIVGNVSVTGAGTEYFNIGGNILAIQASFGSINATGAINTTGNLLASSIIGTIATASQTGITAVGTLATLSVTGNATVGNLVGNEANTRIIANTYVTTFDIYGNVTFPGNITVGGLGVTMPTRPAFRVNGSPGPTQTTANVNLKSPQTSVAFNQGNYYNDTTGQFVAPVAGLYAVGLNARVSTNVSSQIVVVKNGNYSIGNVVCFWETLGNTGSATHFGVNGTVLLAVGDYLSANILLGTIQFDQNDNWHVTYLG